MDKKHLPSRRIQATGMATVEVRDEESLNQGRLSGDREDI